MNSFKLCLNTFRKNTFRIPVCSSVNLMRQPNWQPLRWFTCSSSLGAGQSPPSQVPGVAAAGAVFGAAKLVTVVGALGPAVSVVPVAIVTGAAARLLIPEAARKQLQPGLALCTKSVLRLGIVFVGLKLSAVEAVQMSVTGLPFVLLAMGGGLFGIRAMGRRARLSPSMAALLAAGTSVCGVTAIVALAPAVRAPDREVAVAVANVVAFGLTAMSISPWLAHHWFAADPHAAGLMLGTAVHDTSQVLGAALTYQQAFGDELVLKVATVTKLTRNLCLVGVIPLLTYWCRQQQQLAGGPALDGRGHAHRPSFGTLFPMFVAGFAGASVLRSVGDYTALKSASGAAFGGLLPGHVWSGAVSFLGSQTSPVLIGIAMAALGLSTDLSVFRGVGVRPFVVGGLGALLVCSLGCFGAAALTVFHKFL